MFGPGVHLKLWGVRGSTPTPQPENFQYGGNTSCVEIQTATGERIIFDAGSGIRGLGRCMVREAGDEPIDASIFLTHFHWDHIQGIPFFTPIYNPKNHVTFFSASDRPLQDVLEGQMSKPYFPIDFSQVAARRDFDSIEKGAEVHTKGAIIRPFPLCHPQGCYGYRVESGKAVIVYATDHEHGNPVFDNTLREYAEDADILICDAQYTPEEYETHRGWGHSTFRNACLVARDAGARQLLLFHHDPDHNDATVSQIEQRAREEFENTVAAWEGFTTAI